MSGLTQSTPLCIASLTFMMDLRREMQLRPSTLVLIILGHRVRRHGNSTVTSRDEKTRTHFGS
jgi:hypothetical protein